MRAGEEFLFDAGRGATARYFVEVRDPEAGVWTGRLTLTGPGGARVTAPFEPVDTGETFPLCGGNAVFGADDLACTVTVALPAGSPAGTWSVSAVEITDNAANTAVVTDVTAEPVRLTRNGVLSATGFSVRPAVVDNWRQTKQVAVTLRPVGARGGVQSFSVRTDQCFDLTTDLTANPDGTVTVQWPISTIFSACRITGIVLVDGAGDVALHGSAFSAPAIDLAITRLPDTDPPVALAARLDPTTVTTTQLQQTVGNGVTVTVDNTSPAPVNGYTVTFYDSTERPSAAATAVSSSSPTAPCGSSGSPVAWRRAGTPSGSPSSTPRACVRTTATRTAAARRPRAVRWPSPWSTAERRGPGGTANRWPYHRDPARGPGRLHLAWRLGAIVRTRS